MTLEELQALAAKVRDGAAARARVVRVCQGTGCHSMRSDVVQEALSKEVAARGLSGSVAVARVGCPGMCASGPIVSVGPEEVLYRGVRPEDAGELVAGLGGAPVERLRLPSDNPFFTRQKKIVLENLGLIDPENIEEYIGAEGYSALLNALAATPPADIVAQVSASGLRGRGGAGFPVGLKWATVAKAAGTQKYVICNGDEGDPGAFMDRSVMEGDPHRVLEGMALAAYAVGATRGYVYVRAEYPLAFSRLRKAIRQAEQLGLLGDRIGGSSFSFKVEVRLGAGAFVCGEETALMASVEGRRGTPRPRPPFPAQSGLWGCPTLINNVETLANIAPIVRNGGAWYAAVGTAKSKGTKVFALSGRVVNTGLIEVPMGITLREIIFDIGGGIPEGRKFKAVQTGGPSGGCIPAQHLDMPIDYDSLMSVGSIMGSGGMIIMDETSCMVDVARYFMDFCMGESCGKCVPCRVGTAQMHRILSGITRGTAQPADLGRLEELCDMVRSTSLCGLGQSAPNPVLTTLRYFRDEYEAHIRDRKCPAGHCKMSQEVPA
ncbi:MAG: NADH-ubiquinone oxidoreductase-F iron-sulfur binding region domain-containing protein [Elusimicrobia bacterium]|nr:NADH-ubiquinone oxidoreductase-F iron-sulfur binding region domain-containing protein [Elusimicrobiota bacterium]